MEQITISKIPQKKKTQQDSSNEDYEYLDKVLLIYNR